MAEPKTRPTDASVPDFLSEAPHRADAEVLAAMMQEASGQPAVMWGTSIVGFGQTAGTMPWPVVGFAPRKANLVLYLNTAVEDEYFEDLGPHRRGVGCLYLKRLDGIDLEALRRVIDRSVELSQAAPDVL